MRSKIKSIKERIPQITTLPDGHYTGVWGGYVIEVRYDGKTFELETVEGIRGMGISVVIEIKDGVATFDELKR